MPRSRKGVLPSPTKSEHDVHAENTVDVIDAVASTETTPVHHRRLLPKRHRGVLGLLLVVVIVGGVFLYKYIRPVSSATPSPAQTQAEEKELLAALGNIIVLPQDEVPAIYVVDDASTLAAQQPFFTGAQKGDRLFVYTKAAKAIIYSPERKLIVNVGPITFDGSALPQAQEVE